MFYLIIAIFIIGYSAIALEHTLKIDKAASALITAALVWVCIAFGGDTIYPELTSFQDYTKLNPGASVMDFVTHHELIEHLGEISEILFFLLGAMTIVEIIDSHGGFSILSKIIKTTKKVKLLWIFSFLTFFMSAALDNLTTTIVMIALMQKLIGGKNTRWFFASMVVIAANAGGAWSPIGDVTTIMLWIGGQITAANIIKQLFIPSLICMLIPLIIVSFTMKGNAVPPSRTDRAKSKVPTTDRERWIVLVSGVLGLLFVPVFKSITHLPPYLGVLLVLGFMWVMTEILHRRKQKELRMRLTLAGILKKIDTPTIFFFLGILLAVAGLESAGHLNIFSAFLDEKVHNIYAINIAIGTLSSIVDNVPLVAGTMGMYDVMTPETLATIADPARAAYMSHFVTDGTFWELLAYCAGTGGSMLIIGSAAGVAAMGLTKIDFIWYVKKVTLLAAAGYLSGVAAYYLLMG
ncbi:MAG: sodium:proton antiporter NhaD [Bacteroidales bacterium]|jgi:Na+/H+ antiporter NhaD/arsenite permease-like protein|nr:sodium:proton antiporter NhaD [Bacteroidales bacterium]